MAYRKVDESSLTAVADAIREKGGTSANLAFPTGFVNAIAAIEAGGADGLGPYDVVIMGAGSSACYVEINGTKYTSSAIVTCASGDTITIGAVTRINMSCYANAGDTEFDMNQVMVFASGEDGVTASGKIKGNVFVGLSESGGVCVLGCVYLTDILDIDDYNITVV